MEDDGESTNPCGPQEIPLSNLYLVQLEGTWAFSFLSSGCVV